MIDFGEDAVPASSFSSTGSSTVVDRPKKKIFGKRPSKRTVKKGMKFILKIAVVMLYFITGIMFYKFYEDWDWTDSVFFTVVTICTVGYGTIAPSDDNSRIFTIFYMIFGIYLIFSGIYEYANTHVTKMKFFVKDHLYTSMRTERLKPRRRVLLTSVAIALCVLSGAVFFVGNEGWSFVSGLYFAVETSTTVGYGDLHVKHDSTRLFLVFYMLVSSCLVVYLVNNINAMLYQRRQVKRWRKQMRQKQTLDAIVKALDTDRGVTKHQFVLAVLQHLQIVDAEVHILPWLKKFDELDVAGSGMVSHMQVQLFCHREMEQSRRELQQAGGLASHSSLLQELFQDTAGLLPSGWSNKASGGPAGAGAAAMTMDKKGEYADSLSGKGTYVAVSGVEEEDGGAAGNIDSSGGGVGPSAGCTKGKASWGKSMSNVLFPTSSSSGRSGSRNGLPHDADRPGCRFGGGSPVGISIAPYTSTNDQSVGFASSAGTSFGSGSEAPGGPGSRSQSAVYNDLHHSQLVDRLIMEADQDDDNDEDDEDDEEEEDDDDGPLSRSRQSRIYL